jgi:hypothetical protein
MVMDETGGFRHPSLTSAKSLEDQADGGAHTLGITQGLLRVARRYAETEDRCGVCDNRYVCCSRSCPPNGTGVAMAVRELTCERPESSRNVPPLPATLVGR